MKGIIILLVNKIYNEDCLVGLKKIPDNSIDLVVIDPPYDICTKGGKKGTGRLCYDLTKLENELKGMSLSDIAKNKERIVEEYAKLIKPIDDQRSTAEYRLTVAKNITRKFIDQIVEGGK